MEITSGNLKKQPNTKNSNINIPFIVIAGISGFALWYAIYSKLSVLSSFVTYELFQFNKESQIGSAIEFFLYDTPKVFMLLIIVVFGMGIIRSFFTPEKTKELLSGKSEFVGNIMAACLGVVTPFCSCSAVPLFIGFVTAGVPLGVTFSFLIAAPMVNEIAIGLLYGILGWEIAAIYLGTGLTIAIFSGWVIGRLHLEKYVEDWVIDFLPVGNSMIEAELSWQNRLEAGWVAVKEIIGKVWMYIILGIAVGAAIHGYVPEQTMAAVMGKDAWWSVPLAVVMGIPMYSNAAGIIPVVEALMSKGAALGTVLAFMMSVIALSLPEILILRKVLKPQLIAAFVGIVAVGILTVGFLFNIII